MIRRSTFRQRGVPHTLVVLSDVSAALREEERLAWRRLIRVIGHEISNSLTPIKSIAGSLRSRILPKSTNGSDTHAPPPAPRPRQLPRRNLRPSPFYSATSSAASASSKTAPSPSTDSSRPIASSPSSPRPSSSASRCCPLLERVVSLEIRLDVRLLAAPDVDLLADPDQIEQLLINLVRNAVESALTCVDEEPEAPARQSKLKLSSRAQPRDLLSLHRADPPSPALQPGTSTDQKETDIPVRERSGVSTTAPCTPQVTIRATEEGDLVAIQIEDNGPGLANPDNLFVPLYTTKKSGSGVGLALARQIVEAHGGAIELRNRPNHQGCIAEVRIPIAEKARI